MKPIEADFFDEDVPMRERILRHMRYLEATVFFHPDEEHNQLLDGSAWYFPVSSSSLIARHFGGKVFGYRAEDNPTARRGALDEGYDFCMIDDRWIVDFRSDLPPDPEEADMLFDLHDSHERDRAAELFGNPSMWELVRSFE